MDTDLTSPLADLTRERIGDLAATLRRRVREPHAPSGGDPMDFVQEAVRKVLGGERALRTDLTLDENLVSIAQSLVWNERKKAAVRGAAEGERARAAGDDLGPRGGHLVRIFIAVGVAATIVIAVVLARWGGGAATEPERVDEKAPVAAQDDSAKTAGIRLTYRVPKSLDEPEVGEISFIMRDRLEAIGVKAPVWIHGYRTHKINVNLSRDDRRKLALVKRVLVAPGRFHWAIEATEEELSDPRTGLGPDYDLAAFLHKEVMLAKSKRAYSPDRFGELFAGKVVNLYRNPENPTQPAHDGQKPAFIYYPPNRWKSGGLGNVEGRVRGPHTGAVVHVQESHVFRVAGFAELKAMIRQGTQCIWFELRADAKEPYFRFTRRHVKRRLCLIADGRMLTNPIIQGALPGTGLMTWGGNAEDFQVFAVSVRHGPLEVRPELISEKEVVTKRAKPKPAGK